MEWSTPDLCDAHADVSVVAPLFRSFGGRSSFHGRMVTVRCHEDNSRVRELAGTDGRGKVMVVDGGGSLRRALLGDLIAANAVEHGWEGLLIHGCVRDVEVLATLPLGVAGAGGDSAEDRAAWAGRSRRDGGIGRGRLRPRPLAVCRWQRRGSRRARPAVVGAA